MAIGCGAGYSQGVRGFLDGKAGEVAKLYEVGGFRVFECQTIQGFVEREQFICGRWRRRSIVVQLNASAFAPMFFATLMTGLVDQNVPHGLGRDGEEMALVVVLPVVAADHSHVGFVNESSGVQGLSRGFTSELLSCQSAQLIVDERQQFPGGILVPVLDRFQNVGDA